MYYRRHPLKLFSLLLLGVTLNLATPLFAQDVPESQNKSMREVLEAEKEADRLIKEKEVTNPKSIDAGTTPQSTLLGLRDAVSRQDYVKAGKYLDMRYLPEEMDDYEEEQLIKALGLVWSRQ